MSSREQPPPGEDPAFLAEHAALDLEEREVFRLKLAIPSWLRENPGLSLTMLYLFASIVGSIFQFLFLKRFGFNPLEFSETTDFLMVVVREPLTVALALAGVPFYLVYMGATVRMSRWARGKSALLRSTPEKRRKLLESTRRWQVYLQAAFIGVWALAFVMFFSKWRAQQIRDGDFRKATVHYKSDSPRADGKLAAEGLALLGTTSRFVFLYDPLAKRSEVVPLDSIARLVWDARTRKERESDPAK